MIWPFKKKRESRNEALMRNPLWVNPKTMFVTRYGEDVILETKVYGVMEGRGGIFHEGAIYFCSLDGEDARWHEEGFMHRHFHESRHDAVCFLKGQAASTLMQVERAHKEAQRLSAIYEEMYKQGLE